MIKDLVFTEAGTENPLYRTDKFSGHWGGHTYLELYEQLLWPRRESAQNVLEVGLEYGGSFRLWTDLFSNAQIYGVDINPLPTTFTLQDRMNFIQGNAYDIGFINAHFSGKKFDVIIDDGPHSYDSFIFMARHYSHLLNDGGVLVIEDIPEINFTTGILQAIPAELQSKARVVDNRYINNRWDDILVVIEK